MVKQLMQNLLKVFPEWECLFLIQKYTIVSRGGDQFAITLGNAAKENPLFVSDVNGKPIEFDIQKLIEALQ